ncbi:MAG TPA: hypothetical protein PKI62_09305 [bacterium]|nr:hypothetical protein [bacterium]HPR89275.1 hypothetical protein [bacterium]
MSRWHKTLADRFGSFPKHQQLLMVANELNRASHQLDDAREYSNCLERALELLDLLSGENHWRPALRELRRARQLIAQCYIGPQPVEVQALMRTLIQLDPAAWRMLQAAL